MSGTTFDEAMAARLDVLYGRRDMLRRRALVHELLGAAPGEHVADVGCGPGFYTAELLERVGPTGSITAVDPAEPMRAATARRCAGRDGLRVAAGDTASIPLDDGSCDAALCVQVLEYVDDVDGALAELHRVLRPGGRVVVWDIDWSTVSWHSDDPARMRRVLDAWDHHLAHPWLPRTLAPRLRAAGFEDVEAQGHAFATAAPGPDPETFAVAMLDLIHDFVAGHPAIGADEARAWRDEQLALGRDGRLFASVTQFGFRGRRPGPAGA